MNTTLRAGLIGLALALPALPTAQAATPTATRPDAAHLATATTAMKQMLAAIAHRDYNRFVAPVTAKFKAHVGAVDFGKKAGAIDDKIPLPKPYSVKFVTTQQVGGVLYYIFEITLHNGNQVLAANALQAGKVSAFHLL